MTDWRTGDAADFLEMSEDERLILDASFELATYFELTLAEALELLAAIAKIAND